MKPVVFPLKTYELTFETPKNADTREALKLLIVAREHLTPLCLSSLSVFRLTPGILFVNRLNQVGKTKDCVAVYV